ncbi:MAG TPA: M48 family metalloprotease [Rhodopseudomonas sp.]|uniref:M48 family metalloprotease n=1 Tax=Rhodopseudomonas sp. TaxID=1078 RepID=UPI002ED996AC
MQQEQTRLQRLDPSRLKRGGFWHKIVLIFSAEMGLVMGTIFSGGVGTPLLAGFLVVPLFGLTLGFVGLSRARDRIVKATTTNLLPDDHPLTKAVHGMAQELHLSAMPKVGVYPDNDINAFAAGSGPKKAVVSFSQGLLDRCTNREVLAIAAHELAHIANNDMRRMQYAWSFQNALTWYMMFERARTMVRWLLSTLGEILILKLSRKREFWADATAAALLGKEAMIEALRRLDGDPIEPPASKLAYARLMIRSNPREWFATHPTIANRIAALEQEVYVRKLPFLSEARRTLKREPRERRLHEAEDISH